jgi:hypothetical protein
MEKRTDFRRSNPKKHASIGKFALFSSQNSITVHLNMSERENGQLPLAKRTMRSRISGDVWEQTKTAYASGIGTRDDIEGTRLRNPPAQR